MRMLKRSSISCFIVFVSLFTFIAVLGLSVEVVPAKEIVVFEGQKVQVPEDVPDYTSWKAGFPKLFPEGLIAVIYDNPDTPDNKEDLTEMYDLDNRLLSIGWYDNFGTYRIILDSGLLTKEKSPIGVLKTVQDVNESI